MLIALPPDELSPAFSERLAALARAAPERSFLAGVHRYRGDEPRRLGLLEELGERTGAPLVAVNDVIYHVPERRPLADVLTCIREKCTVARSRLPAGGQRGAASQAARGDGAAVRGFPDAIARTVEIAEACSFSLDELQVRISRRAGAAGQDRAAASRRPDLGGRRVALSQRSISRTASPRMSETSARPRNSRSSPSSTMRAIS